MADDTTAASGAAGDAEVQRKGLKPKPVGDADLAAILLRGWGLTLRGLPRELDSYDDRNYDVRAHDAAAANLVRA